MSELTVPSQFDHQADGYIVIAPFSDEMRQNLYDLQGELTNIIPRSKMWLPQGDQLHVTFAHIISPDREYSIDRTELFGKVGDQAKQALAEFVPNPLNIPITFDKLQVFAGAIILKGKDDGSYGRMRQQFIEKFDKPEGTREPPEIIHTTIARFRRRLDLDEIRERVSHLSVSLSTHTTELQVIHEEKIYVQQHTVLERFPQQGLEFFAKNR